VPRAADKRPSNIALGLYQNAPQLASDGVEDDPQGVTFWKVKHGIRFTGMPGYSQTLTDAQIWTLALFLNRMDKLPPARNASGKRREIRWQRSRRNRTRSRRRTGVAVKRYCRPPIVPRLSVDGSVRRDGSGHVQIAGSADVEPNVDAVASATDRSKLRTPSG